MPNRILRDGILTSELVNSLSDAAEMFYRRLMSVVDDYGRFAAHPLLLKAACYPLKPAVQSHDIIGYLRECAVQNLILVYAIAGKKYLEIQRFNQRMRLMRSRYPEPTEECRQTNGSGLLTDDGHMTVKQDNDSHAPTCQTYDGVNLNLNPILNPISTTKKKEEKKKDILAAKAARNVLNGLSASFSQFWSAYPRKVARVEAEKAFAKLHPDESTLLAILGAIDQQRKTEDWSKDSGRFIPHPATWLNKRRWEDEVLPATGKHGGFESTNYHAGVSEDGSF